MRQLLLREVLARGIGAQSNLGIRVGKALRDLSVCLYHESGCQLKLRVVSLTLLRLDRWEDNCRLHLLQ